MSRQQDSYQNRSYSALRAFYEENCDETWEQIKDLRRSRALKLTAIIVGLLIALFLIAALVINSFFIKPELPDWANRHNGGTEDSIDYGDGIQPAVSGERKSKDYYTVLVLGRDTGGGGNTDTMLLASYDVTNQKATVMSIPRDTMVNVPWDIKRINSVYNYNGQGSKGIAALYKEISQLVGFEPDYQVIVEWDAVGEIVEAMGGIYFEVPRNMNYDDPYQDLHIHQEKGYRLLSGSDVMQVLRYRHDNDMRYGYADGDLGRIKTQQALLKAMITQLLQIKNITKIGDFAKAVKNNVESDLSFNEMLWFGKQAVMGGLSVEDVNFLTMPNTATYAYSRSTGAYQSYVVPNANDLLKVVNHELSPFTKVFTLRDLDIMSVNEDGSLSSSTGYVEDQKAAVPPVIRHENPDNEEQIFDEDGNLIVGGDEPTDEPISADPTVPEEEDPGIDTPPEEMPGESVTEEPTEPEETIEYPDWLLDMY